jgi:RNA-directed DNA polymerase
MASVTRSLKRTLRLMVNEAKSAVDRPWNRTFRGFTFTKRQFNRRKARRPSRHSKRRCERSRAARGVGPCNRSCRSCAS